MRFLLLACLVVLGACASSRWVNPVNPGANLENGVAACSKDAERIARLNQLEGSALGRSCNDGRACLSLAETQRVRIEAEAGHAQRRCMEARGWRLSL